MVGLQEVKPALILLSFGTLLSLLLMILEIMIHKSVLWAREKDKKTHWIEKSKIVNGFKVLNEKLVSWIRNKEEKLRWIDEIKIPHERSTAAKKTKNTSTVENSRFHFNGKL